jgi:hypothetical protein
VPERASSRRERALLDLLGNSRVDHSGSPHPARRSVVDCVAAVEIRLLAKTICPESKEVEMKSNVNKARVHALFAIGTCLFSGCGGPSDESRSGVNNAGGASDDVIHGNLLHSLELTPAHRIDFYEFADGQTALRETYKTEGARAVLQPLSGKGLKTLAELYQHFAAPGTSVPSAIGEADVRAANLQRSNYAPVRPVGRRVGRGATGDNVGRSSPADGLGQDRQAVLECSADLFGDNWGEQWFRNNYCEPPIGTDNYCFTNDWVEVEEFTSCGLDYFQFEGDFDNGGSVRMAHESCSFFSCSFVEDWNGFVSPRDAFHWYYNYPGTWRVTGKSNCGHLDRSFTMLPSC